MSSHAFVPMPTGADARWRTLVRACVLLGLGAAVLAGASSLAFLCDDAFITFRYVGNAMDGHGLVWNPPPFRPVEGYTSFAWAVVLWGTWSWFGIEPPDAANVLSIACGLCTFAVTAMAAFAIRGRDGRRLPDLAVFVALGAIVANRTFLQWMSSGLETSLCNLTFVGWSLLGFRAREGRTVGWLWAWSACAAATALTRPDGLLLVAATVAVTGIGVLRRQWRLGAALRGLLPLTVVLAHLGWRRAFYGEWLPNTFFAKVGEPWPEAGVRYLGLFLVENGGWLWLLLAVVWIGSELRRGLGAVVQDLWANVPATAAVAGPVVLAAYYLWAVGGDHFEFRIFSHLVPLGGLAAAAMAWRLRPVTAAPVLATLGIGLAALVGWIVPLVQPPTTFLYEPLAPHVPAVVQPFARWYDRQRAWLSLQAVAVRCDQHRLFLAAETSRLPDRARGERNASDVPVHAADCVGRLGWVLPDVAILDRLALNDWVAARWPEAVATNVPDSTPLDRLLATADRDGDARITRGEAEAAVAALPAADAVGPGLLVPLVFLVFADGAGDLRTADAPAIGRFFAGLRRMAHDRHAPADYVAAFDPNVDIVDRQIVVRPRTVPLDAGRIAAIEAEWRGRVQQTKR